MILASVVKVNAAISDPQPGETSINFYYIHPDDIVKHNLPRWLVGCNAAGECALSQAQPALG